MSPSSSGSFCVVKEDAHDAASLPRPRSSNQKTVEELELENASLKTGLDTMSHHAQMLADELKAIRAKEEKREELMKSVVLGVRMEVRDQPHLSPHQGSPRAHPRRLNARCRVRS